MNRGLAARAVCRASRRRFKSALDPADVGAVAHRSGRAAATMTTDTATPRIDVDALRVGMFVHLDMSWMSHPFAIGSFRITSQEQIQTIRGLGKRSLRWSPDKSESAPDEPDLAAPDAPGEDVDAAPAAAPAEDAERLRHRAALAAQRDALRVCEQQFGEAMHAFGRTLDLVSAQPAQAREQAQALSRTLAEKMLGASNLNIRLLSETAGDKAGNHAINVALISMLMGRGFGLSGDEMVDLGVGAMLHDIGKLDLPERIRYRDDRLTPTELDYYRRHVALGVTQGKRMGLASGALLIIAQHHEQTDGEGFPMQLNIDRMTALARIVALVNRYDGLCNPPIPSRALTPHEALSLMFAQGQKQFDTTMLSAFIKMMGVYPPGSVVQLTDERYALVVSVNSTRPLKPRVLVHEADVPPEEALVVDLEQAPALGIRRSLKPLQLPREVHDYLSPRQRISYFFEPAVELESHVSAQGVV